MRKILLCAALLLLILPLAACNNSGNRTPGGNDKISIPEMNPPLPPPEYPVIDGSSSTVTMHSAIRAYLTDMYLVDSHSKTYAALERLIPGSADPADVVLSVKYYDETLQDAKNRGADLVITPIAKEGFVFILSKNNPVNKLTQRQLRDIYSGKITNWKDVGGLDEAIIPYIRNWDSGSQTAMEDFMGGEPIVGEKDSIIFSMEFILTRVQNTGSPGIGYSIYSWFMGQNLDRLGLKTVAVDGVKPNNKTLADSRYPLMVYTYSYYNKGNEKGKALTDWLLTAEGQGVIASAGYVGIFGDLSADEPPDFNKDENDSLVKIEEYYSDSGTLELDKISFYSERLPDRALTETYAAGPGKAVTVLYLVHFYEYETEREYTRFIVLTREKGGAFEVINEGEAPPELLKR